MTYQATTTKTPWAVASGAIITYTGTLFLLYSKRSKEKDKLRLLVKAISAGHSTTTTILTIVALSQKWDTTSTPLTRDKNADVWLDDSTNPWITGQNRFANFITAWEAGYLIYDTGALFLVAYSIQSPSSHRLRNTLSNLMKSSPVFLAHHVLLASALLYLQTYIATGRVRGIRIIMAFFLMNASNPLLHLRWWRKKVTGYADRRIDMLLAATFALTRFGTVYWIVKEYGKHHGLTSYEAMRRQRWQCKTGTGLLIGLNGIWWLALIRQLTTRTKTRQ